LRAWTGLVLVAYAGCHLANHSLGLISLDVMEAARRSVFAVWHTPPGEALLIVALIVHAALALQLLATRRSLRLAPWQWLQLTLGLAIPLVLIKHVVATVVLERQLGADLGYPGVLLAVWPEQVALYTLLVIVVWCHGCIGLHHWWRIDHRYARWFPLLLAGAVALPALAVGGFIAAGRDAVARGPAQAEAWAAEGSWPDPAHAEALVAGIEQAVLGLLLGGLAAALGWRAWAAWQDRRHSLTINYPSTGRTVRARIGTTLLDISREAGIPHAAVCGGRARCSTCRVRVNDGSELLPAPGQPEARLLARLGNPKDVRLACQITPTSPLTVVPLVAPPVALADARGAVDPSSGREREISVLFADLRGFTRLTEHRLPYDVIYVLNEFFRAMGEVVEDAGGHLDKVVGDGLMALFGLETGPDAAARAALTATSRMAHRLEPLNASLAADIETPLRMAIGLHHGPAVVGLMGHGRARQLTAIGDTVNVASRLESLAKSHDVQLVASEAVLARAGSAAAAPTRIEVRGRSEPLAVGLFPNARDLSAPLPIAAG
jgi:adenylate cyclase